MTNQDKTSLITIIVSIIGIILIFKSCDISSPSSNYSSYSQESATAGIEILFDKWCKRYDNHDCSVCGEVINKSSSSRSFTLIYKIYDKDGYQVGIAPDYIPSLSPNTKARFEAPAWCDKGKGRYVFDKMY